MITDDQVLQTPYEAARLLKLFIGVSSIIILHFMYYQYVLFADVDVWKALFVLIELHGYIYLGDLSVPIINAVCDMVTYALTYRHTEYVRDDLSIYKLLYVAIVYSMPSGSHVEMIIGCVVMLLTSYGMDQDLDTKHQIIGCEGLHHQ